MNDNLYILDACGRPVREPDIRKWGEWFEANRMERIVARDTIGDSKVSTVFLGIDHDYHGEAPVLWETMVFGGRFDQDMDRCGGSREQAEAMHVHMVKRVKKGTR